MASTGSLGHGLGIVAGMALASLNKKKYYYILLSDGELQEGSIWEAALIISSLKLNNIIVIVVGGSTILDRGLTYFVK